MKRFPPDDLLRVDTSPIPDHKSIQCEKFANAMVSKKIGFARKKKGFSSHYSRHFESISRNGRDTDRFFTGVLTAYLGLDQP